MRLETDFRPAGRVFEYFRDLVRREQEEEARKSYLVSRLESGAAQLASGAWSDLTSDEEIDRLFDTE